MQYDETLRRTKFGLRVHSDDIQIDLMPLVTGKICFTFTVTRDPPGFVEARREVKHDIEELNFLPSEVSIRECRLTCMRTPDPTVPEFVLAIMLDLTPRAAAALQEAMGPLKDTAVFAMAIQKLIEEELARSCEVEEVDLIQQVAIFMVFDATDAGQAIINALGTDLRRELGKRFLDALHSPRVKAALELRSAKRRP